MNQTPEYLLGPHKSTIITAARELLHVTSAGGVAFEIPGLVPRHVVVLGAESEICQLLEAPAREPMIGGRRKEDVRPTEPLNWGEPAPAKHFSATASDDDLWHIAVLVVQMTGGTLLDISQRDCVTAIRAAFMDPDSASAYAAARARKKGD